MTKRTKKELEKANRQLEILVWVILGIMTIVVIIIAVGHANLEQENQELQEDNQRLKDIRNIKVTENTISYWSNHTGEWINYALTINKSSESATVYTRYNDGEFVEEYAVYYHWDFYKELNEYCSLFSGDDPMCEVLE